MNKAPVFDTTTEGGEYRRIRLACLHFMACLIIISWKEANLFKRALRAVGVSFSSLSVGHQADELDVVDDRTCG
jgi:hypothetical protein